MRALGKCLVAPSGGRIRTFHRGLAQNDQAHVAETLVGKGIPERGNCSCKGTEAHRSRGCACKGREAHRSRRCRCKGKGAKAQRRTRAGAVHAKAQRHTGAGAVLANSQRCTGAAAVHAKVQRHTRAGAARAYGCVQHKQEIGLRGRPAQYCERP